MIGAVHYTSAIIVWYEVYKTIPVFYLCSYETLMNIIALSGYMAVKIIVFHDRC